ncbi:MAG: DNA-binding response regulator [Nitrosospira sp.]|nr:DNA-binding response regulator [Nitrosospira sp.]MDN5836039.1 DNA-binding response regulator [Nitrosospira sp.]MDN5881471.1 DNA-binding response regulator [Nitrosospira sp.]
MQVVTVAIADTDPRRRAKLEQSLQGGQGVKVLANAMSNGGVISTGPGLQRRMDITAIEDVVARVSRLKPRILFVDLSQSADEDFTLLGALTRECPETRVILLTDKSVPDEQIIQALANGARGCLNHEADPFYFLKAVRVVDRGEAWVTRRMLSKIMDEVLH